MKCSVVLSIVLLTLGPPSNTVRAQTVINFDDIAGMPPPFDEGMPVLPQYLISNPYLCSGVLFSSAGGGIVVGAAINCPSPPNCASATRIRGGAPVMSYTEPVFASFWVDPATSGVVDYVSITLTDTSSLSTLSAYDNFGTFLGSTMGGRASTLTVTFPGRIHSVRIDQGPMAFDNFTFNGLAHAGAETSPAPNSKNSQNPPVEK